MNSFTGTTLSWSLRESAIELELHRLPANEIGTEMLAELEQFIAALDGLAQHASSVIVHSSLASGFSAGADLRELYKASLPLDAAARLTGVREFLHRIHAVLNALDDTPLSIVNACGSTWKPWSFL